MGQKKPVVMNAKDLQFVILMDPNYEGYAKRKAGLKFYLVDPSVGAGFKSAPTDGWVEQSHGVGCFR